MGADARLDETPIRVVMTDEQREVMVRAVTSERDRARRRAANVTKPLPGENCYELTDRDMTTILGLLIENDVIMSAHLWNQVSWALSERIRVADYWHEETRSRRGFLVGRLEEALTARQPLLDLDA